MSTQGKCRPPPQRPPLYAAFPQLSPHYPLDFGDLEKTWVTKTNKASTKKSEKGTTSLPVGVSSERFSPPFSASGVGESRRMELTISSTSRASASAVLGSSYAKGLGSEEVTSVGPLASRSALLQIHTGVKKYSI